MLNPNFALGLESCLATPPSMLRKAKFGLLMNRASVDRRLRFACDLLNETFPGQLTSLFTPQHGLWGDAQANMVETPDQWHSRLGVPVYSLYSQTRRPTAAMLDGIDCLIVDLQDVGTRVYTFVWTVLECMRACATGGITMLILDRPNPIGGVVVEGPLLESTFRSFVGGADIPMRHGLTIGELAILLQSELKIDVELNVQPLQDWQPGFAFDSLHRRWLLPSPNLPTLASVRVYPGQVLLEGTNLSEGRGTTTPFEVCGAPFIDADSFAQALSQLDLPGVQFLPNWFQPCFDKWQGNSCGGVSIHITDAELFRSFRTTIEILRIIQSHYPNQFRWLDPPYEYETIKPPIDILFGSDALRRGHDSIESLTKVDARAWGERTYACQLYERSDSRFRS